MRELLAKIAHKQWAGWMKHLFSKGKSNSDGTWTMPAWAVNRWKHQMNMKYEDLTEEEKNSDKQEADKFIDVMKSFTLVEISDMQKQEIKELRELLHHVISDDYTHDGLLEPTYQKIKKALNKD